MKMTMVNSGLKGFRWSLTMDEILRINLQNEIIVHFNTGFTNGIVSSFFSHFNEYLNLFPAKLTYVNFHS